MNIIKEYGKIAKVGLDLVHCPSLFEKLKYQLGIEADTPFKFLNKLISTTTIDIDPKNPRYEILKDAISELVVSEDEYETASKIMSKLGSRMPEGYHHPSGPSPMEVSSGEEIRSKKARPFEKDSSVEMLEPNTGDIAGHAIISRFNIDHLRGITWPDIWYEEFYRQTEKIFGDKIVEISAGNSADFTDQVNGTTSKINTKVPIYVIIFGFSPCFDDEEPFFPGHFIIPVVNGVPETYSMEKFYEIQGLENKKKILILFTLPSPKLQLKSTTDSYKFDVDYRMSPKTIFFQCPISCTNIWEEIVSKQKLEVFLRRLQDKKYFKGNDHLFYYNNFDSIGYRTEETDAVGAPQGNKHEPSYGEGMAFSLSFGDSNPKLNGLLSVLKRRICTSREWNFIEDINKISDNNLIKQNDPNLKDKIGNIRTEIQEEGGIKCILIFINQFKSWETKDNSINSYVDIVRTVSHELENLELTKIFINLNTNEKDPTYDKEDARKIEKGINQTKDTFFILSDENFVAKFSSLIYFQRNQPTQFSYRLRGTVDKTISIKDNLPADKKKPFKFVQVISSPDCGDFIFPPPINI